MLSEIKSEKDKYYMLSLRYGESKKYNKLVVISEERKRGKGQYRGRGLRGTNCQV